MVYFTDVSCLDNIGWYINRFCLSWTVIYPPVLSVVNNIVVIYPWFVCHDGLSPCFVCRRQYWLVCLPMLYVMNKNGWYITRFCLLWTVMVGISPRFFCRGQNWLVYQPD